MKARHKFIALGVNVGNLGKQPRRTPMKQWVKIVNEKLTGVNQGIRIQDFYGHTGNFVITAATDCIDSLFTGLEMATATHFAILTIRELSDFLVKLQQSPHPPHQDGIRWTPGGVFSTGVKQHVQHVNSTIRAIFEPFSPGIIAAWKCDIEDDTGRLDRNRRNGGWGALSIDIQYQITGTWTARSERTLDGILRLAKRE